MANQFVNLPVPAGNGVGASVDVSTFGASKSIVVGGDCSAQVTIEVNNDAGQLGGWAALKTFQNTGELVVDVACRWMRVRISNYNVHVGGQATCDVGGTDDGTSFQALAAPVGNGAAASGNTSALGEFKTVQCGGQYRGTTIVEVSEDGSSWGQPFAFGSQSGGIKSLLVTAEFMRVRRVGVPKVDPGIPVVTVGACVPGGGGGAGGVDVDRDGALVVAAATTLNFLGARVVNAGGGEADITPAAVFDNAAGPLDTNIRGARLTNQSPIDNTKAQITNFGSQDHLVDPAATGATGVGSTIGGGNDHSASGDGSTIPGGVANIASGVDSFAEGHGCQATGPQSHAEGALTTASGPAGGSFPFGGSHAEGMMTVASGVHAHAEGGQTVASGHDSHAEGGQTQALGDHSHAEGFQSVATDDTDHAEGYQCTASGGDAHAEGARCQAGGGCHAEGVDTKAGVVGNASGSHAEGSGTVADAIGGPIVNFGAHAEGYQSTPRSAAGIGANAWAAHVEGLGNQATGAGAHAEGGGLNGPKTDLLVASCNLASGEGSHAEGQGNLASGVTAHAEGSLTTASGDTAHAEGNQNTASGVASHAEGTQNTASGDSSHAEGGGSTIGNTASGGASHAEGISCTASGAASHAQGNSCLASGPSSHAGGDGCQATGDSSFATGLQCQATNPYAFASGQLCIASQNMAHATGLSCLAQAVASHAHGSFASAPRLQQSFAAGAIDGVTAGTAQTNHTVLKGTTPGVAPAESVELQINGQPFLPENGKTYTMSLEVAAGGVQAGPVRASKGWTMYFNIRRSAGLTVIAGSWGGGTSVEAASADWTVVVTIGAAPDRLVVTFKTGAVITAAKVAARLQFTEVAF